MTSDSQLGAESRTNLKELWRAALGELQLAMPKANYDIWVRGYGLVDSPKMKSAPGKLLNLKAVRAPNETAAAQYYPAIYWFSMMKIPEASVFGSKPLAAIA